MNRQAVHLNAHEVTPVGLWSLRAGAPTVATVVSLNFPGLTPHTRDLMRRFTRTALQGLVNTGARPILVDSSARQLPDPAVTATADAVLVLGGGDVDPALYGVGGPVPNAYGVDRRADLYTMDLLGRSLDRDVPLLAIGRGSHLLNVACGGTLVPDLGTGHGHRGEPGDPMCPEQEVALEPGSRLATVFGAHRLAVRSDHHQAVDVVAPELRVAAVADDGVVEATEHRERTWAIGVQWHPEDSHGSAADRGKLFSAFVAQAGAARRRAPRPRVLAA
ncbi:gamma-glutamyl-gamma-aminobutyrate hydrolase family protein [Kocuria himachalensis]